MAAREALRRDRHEQAALHAGAVAAAIAQCFGSKGNSALKEFQAALDGTDLEPPWED